MLHLPSRSSAIIAAPPSSTGRAPSSPESSPPNSPHSTNPTSPSLSLAALPIGGHYHHGNGGVGGGLPRASPRAPQTEGTRRGPRERARKIEEMSYDELDMEWTRNSRVLSDRTIFPPLPPSFPEDPHRVRLLETQSALEHRMALLSTQASSPPVGPDMSLSMLTMSLGSPPSSSELRRPSASSPKPTHATPSKRGLTNPLGLDESIALQAHVVQREREQAAARQLAHDLRAAERATAGMSLGERRDQGGRLGESGKGRPFMDELERIRGEARIRAFMNPSQDPFYMGDDDDDFYDDDDLFSDVDDVLGLGAAAAAASGLDGGEGGGGADEGGLHRGGGGGADTNGYASDEGDGNGNVDPIQGGD